MNLQLTKNLCFFDVESTGLNVIRDRIIQIAIIRVNHKDHSLTEYHQLINPGPVFISAEAAAVHGITNETVRNKPVFSQLAQEIYDFIGDADLAGYNSNRFDIPILMEEFARAGYKFSLSNRRTIDVQQIFYKMEPRTLKAAYRFYCNRELVDAHDAMADVRATIDVFTNQLDYYDGKDMIDEEGNVVPGAVTRDLDELHAFTTNLKTLDATQRLKYNQDGIIVFNFGKYLDHPVEEIFRKEKGYYNWMMSKEFSQQVKEIITAIHKSMQC